MKHKEVVLKKNRKKLQDLFFVFSSNSINLVFGLFTAVALPIFLSVNGYADFRTFMLYASFVGLASLGFNDGFYVKYGKFNFDEIPYTKFRTYFRFLLIFQISVAITIVLIYKTFLSEYLNIDGFLFFSIISTCVVLNTNTFFNFTNQFTKNFSISFFNNLYTKIFILLFISVCILIYSSIKAEIVISVFLLSYLFSLILNMYVNRKIVIGPRIHMKAAGFEIIDMLKTGFLLMLGAYVALFVLGTSQVIVQVFYSSHDFAMFAFSLSMLNVIYILIKAFSTVLFPYLARINENYYDKFYKNISVLLTILITFLFSSFYIIAQLITNYLDKYSDGIIILLFLFPVILYDSIYNVVSFNFYKVLKNQKEMLKNNFIVVIFSLIILLFLYNFSYSVSIIAFGTLLNFIIWNFLTNFYYEKKLEINLFRLYNYQILLTVIFLIVALNFEYSKGFFIYIILYSLVTWLFYKNEVLKIIKLRFQYLYH